MIARTQIVSVMQGDLATDGIKLSPKVLNAVITALQTAVAQYLCRGLRVHLKGFGHFYVIETKARLRMNPRKKGEKVSSAACITPKFSAGRTLHDAVNR